MRPDIIHVGGVLYWTIQTRNPDTQLLKDADATPTVAVRKNGTSVADSVTITKRSATTGLYDCSYNPAAEVEGDTFQFEESATVTGTTTSSATYTNQFSVRAVHVGAVELDPASLRSALGMSAADLDSQLDAILAATSAGAGTGARTVTVTVNDGTTALQNAVVRLSEGLNTYRTLTNASGVAVFNVDDATYTVAVTKSGYTYAGTTMVVNGTETATYSMTVVSITPPDGPTKTVLTILCLDENGDADSGVNVSIRYVTIPTDSVDIAFPGASITKTSNGSGIATFQVIKGATIEYKRGTRDVWLQATMSNEDTTSITSFIGTP
jgi:hypothetical protein